MKSIFGWNSKKFDLQTSLSTPERILLSCKVYTLIGTPTVVLLGHRFVYSSAFRSRLKLLHSKGDLCVALFYKNTLKEAIHLDPTIEVNFRVEFEKVRPSNVIEYSGTHLTFLQSLPINWNTYCCAIGPPVCLLICFSIET